MASTAHLDIANPRFLKIWETFNRVIISSAPLKDAVRALSNEDKLGLINIQFYLNLTPIIEATFEATAGNEAIPRANDLRTYESAPLSDAAKNVCRTLICAVRESEDIKHMILIADETEIDIMERCVLHLDMAHLFEIAERD
ncbi:MAG: hypothetical protein COW88_01010 [Candidatus Lloydbacteria bacterium CG22_combo_CG10-13_8_21_14_all_47_15]|uniref:Uncharacterized protein n=1 Tax=Candidatus Lloydbacteria bacterium CG22_combo_CG10-13_8_21_14_all_47_15 TaxID=1974635 RepID=A0A2H0CUY4_9BACT|nr:MAG: hypothetical protein COW88_01010 [Candidatus Lloydbacteria bacterium CG22_combo_CG10-13_8_21_14_all_47_15]